MVFREFASHASIADRVASRVASQKSFCESRLKADSQYNFLRRDMRLATHATSCDSDTRFTIFFMIATSSCTSSTMHVHCTCSQGRNRTPFVYIACRMSQKLNFLQLLGQVHCDSLRQLATARDRQFLVATVANRVSRRRKLYCESAFRRRSHMHGAFATPPKLHHKSWDIPGSPWILRLAPLAPRRQSQKGHNQKIGGETQKR